MNNNITTNTKLSQKKLLTSVIAGVIFQSQGAFSAGTLEEVIVTSTKTMENVQDVPQAITAFTSEDLDNQNILGIDDYAKLIPSLAFAKREPGGTTIVFRGVSASGIQYYTNPSSSVYLDEQSISSAGANPNPRIIDIERLEALSGPQGTLFGDASQSGALRIITNKPKSGKFEAWIEGNIESVTDGDEGTDVSFMVNVPIIEDKLALRLVGFTAEEAGYIDNVLSKSPGGTYDNADYVEDDINSGTQSGLRAALRWEVNDKWMIDTAAIFQKTESDGFGDTNPNQGLDNYEQVRFNDESYQDEWYQLSVTAEGDLGFGVATLSASYFNREVDYTADATDYHFSFQEINNGYEALGYDLAIYDFGGDPHGRTSTQEEDERWNLEGRLVLEDQNDSRWSAVVGAFYNKAKINNNYGTFVDGFSESPAGYYLNSFESLNDIPTGSWGNAVDSDNWYYSLRNRTIKNKAIFGEFKYNITEYLSVLVGGRWYENDTESSQQQGAFQIGSKPNINTDLLYNDVEGEGSDSGFIPKINITYNIDSDKLVYATYSEGFRGGGSNANRPSSILPEEFGSDTLINHEIGVKTTWLDNSLRFNLLIYQMVWEDIQVQVNDPTVFQLATVNFPEAEINGYEVDLTWAPINGLEIGANFTEISAEVSENLTLTGVNPADSSIVNIASAVDGTKLPITPNKKVNVSVQYDLKYTLWDAAPFVRLDYSHTGESVNALPGLEATVGDGTVSTHNPYDTFDFQAGLNHEGWSASIYVKNLTNKYGEVFNSNRWVEQRLSVLKPRTVGISIKKYFD
ncbi:TonB-dependent receptor [Dasania marina]|uniref:TonB-dependent receptor n=1 Tax=Dasania marina TaxID=471499 RepID=UPI0030DBBD9C|tara:strand:+ start:77310 stop:79706 length:2397 start_codon:yes stop_codon:yes gene_type:complete